MPEREPSFNPEEQENGPEQEPIIESLEDTKEGFERVKGQIQSMDVEINDMQKKIDAIIAQIRQKEG